MLLTQSVAPGTLELLKSLQAKPYLDGFVLVGGTALAFHWGLKTYSLGEMVAFYKEKYSQQHAGHVVKSLIWFSDADLSDWPVMLKEPSLRWKEVTQHIEAQVIDFSRNP